MLLDPGRLVACLPVIPPSQPGLRNTVEALRDTITGIDPKVLAEALEVGRMDRRYALQRHYRVRNQIVHEGLHMNPGLELTVQMLEQIVEDVLRKIFGHAIAPAGTAAATLDELVEWDERPWSQPLSPPPPPQPTAPPPRGETLF